MSLAPATTKVLGESLWNKPVNPRVEIRPEQGGAQVTWNPCTKAQEIQRQQDSMLSLESHMHPHFQLLASRGICTTSGLHFLPGDAEMAAVEF